MSLIFNSKTVIKELKALRKQLSSDLINPINRAATASRNRIAKELSDTTGVSLMNLKKSTKTKGLIKIVKAKTYKGNRLFATIIISGKKLSIYTLAKGRVKPSGRGSVATIKGRNMFFPGAFVATVNKGRHTGLFKRKGSSRLPITEIKMLSNPDLFRDLGIGVEEAKRVIVDVKKFYEIAKAKRLAKFNAQRVRNIFRVPS